MTSPDRPASTGSEDADFGEGAADAFPEATPQGGAPEAQQADVTSTGTADPPSEERARI